MSTLPTQVKNSSGRLLRVGKQLGKGGEGAVHEAVNENDVAIKIYWPNKAAERRDKIAAMVSAGWFKSSSFVAFPIDVLYAANGTFVGFLMKKVGGQKPIHLLYSPASRKREFAIANFRFLVRTALNIARAVATVHSTGCVIGDINHSESVREHQAGLQSFRSMRRIDARRKNASALRLRFSQSLASLRQRLSQAMVRSTTQRRGSTTNPLA